jgi:hypothetical protein
MLKSTSHGEAMKNKETSLQWILGSTCIMALFVYAFFFLFLPQSWTLNNDYGMLKWYTRTGASHNFLQELKFLIASGKSEGRFMIIYWVTLVARYLYLPLKPLVFNSFNFILALISITAFADFLKSLKLTLTQILLALTMVVTAFTMKDWLAYTAVVESLATTFLVLSLALYARGKKWPSLLLFILSFLTKESFFVAAPVFLFFEHREYQKTKRWNLLFIFSLVISVSVFVLYVKSLPRVYTAGKFMSFSAISILKGLILPPLKNFLPFFALIGYGFLKKQRISKENMPSIIAGALIVVSFSIFLSLWGDYDSWSYLHVAIPFGWAMILAGLLQPAQNTEIKTQICLVIASCFFGLIIATNGSFNLWTFFANAKTTAEIACSDFKAKPNLQLFTNCQEGSVQLANYLFLSGQCASPPEIKWMPTGHLPANIQPPYELLLSSRWCTPYDTSISAPNRIELRHWTILKNLGK